MFNVKLFSTKTFWVGLIAILTGIGQIFYFNNMETGIEMIVGGLAVITGRDALAKIPWKEMVELLKMLKNGENKEQ